MKTGWLNVNGVWYYLNGDGAMQTGWQTIGGVLYYLDPASGQIAANQELELNGVRYQADGSGACTPVPETASQEQGAAAPESASPEQGIAAQAPASQNQAAAAQAPASQGQGAAAPQTGFQDSITMIGEAFPG